MVIFRKIIALSSHANANILINVYLNRYFLGSTGPTNAVMQKNGSFEDALMGKSNILEPRIDCTWTFHLYALPKDNEAKETERQMTQLKAYAQIEENKEFRSLKMHNLSISFAATLSQKYTVESLMARKMAHKLSKEKNELSLLEKYIDFNNRGFSNTTSSHAFLKKVYGTNSEVYHQELARFRANEKAFGCYIPDEELIKPTLGSPKRFCTHRILNMLAALFYKYFFC